MWLFRCRVSSVSSVLEFDTIKGTASIYATAAQDVKRPMQQTRETAEEVVKCGVVWAVVGNLDYILKAVERP